MLATSLHKNVMVLTSVQNWLIHPALTVAVKITEIEVSISLVGEMLQKMMDRCKKKTLREREKQTFLDSKGF
jgi:hypothetical protein